MKSADSGRAIIVLVVAFGIHFLIAVLMYGAGIIHLSLLDVFNMDDATTSIVGSLLINLMSITGPMTSYCINRWSCRVTSGLGGIILFVGLSASFFAKSFWIMLMTYGITSGIGIGLAILPCPVAIGYVFRKHSGLAMGITTSGTGLGMLTSGPITKHLLDTYGLRGTFLILAAIVSHIIPCGMLLRTPPNKELETVRKEDKYEYLKTYITLLKTPAYMCVLLGAIMWNISYAVLMVHLPNYVVHSGFSKDKASFMFTVIGIGTILSRLTIGLASGPNGLDSLLLNFGLTAFMGGLIATFPLFITYSAGPIIFASLYGIYSGGLLVFTVPLCLEMAGMDKLTSAIGLWFFLLGLGSFIGPPLAGLVLDMTGSYGYSFFLSGLLTLLASAFSLLASVWRKSENRKSATQQCEFSVLTPKEDINKHTNYDDIMLSKEQGQKLMSNDTY